RLFTMFPKKIMLMTGVLSTILISITTVGLSYLVKLLIDAVVEERAVPFFNLAGLSLILIAFLMLFQFLKTRMLGGFTEKGLEILRERYAAKMNTMSLDSMQQSHSGDILSRGTNDMNRVRNFTLELLPELIEIPLSAVLALGVLLFLSWQLTLATMALLPVLLIGATLLSKPIGPLSHRVQAKLGHANQTVTDFIRGVEVAKAYTLEEPLKGKHDAAVDDSVKSGEKLARSRALLEGFSMFFSILPFIVTFILGGYFVTLGTMTMGGLLAFITLLNRLTFPLSSMSTLIGEARRDMASAGRIFETLDAPDERQDGTAFEFSNADPIIDFEHVSFTYPLDSDPVIKDLSLKIHPKETLALVGPSGGGKSTLAKLIAGFYDDYEGSIRIGGHEIRDWHLPTLRKHLGIVAQDSFLFPESLRENIAHGREDADDEAIMDAARKAYAHDFIEALAEGYDTPLSELGDSLSGGQKQRIALARAILKDAPILLLDEATSALDSDSEQMIQTALKSLLIDKTAIIIAHRLSTIRDADTIYAIDEGRIVESGTHEALIRKGGLYSELYHQEMRKGGDTDEKEDL
ncbi:MAG: ABC transporter ATP-binding protein, partial [Bacillota bacterium]